MIPPSEIRISPACRYFSVEALRARKQLLMPTKRVESSRKPFYFMERMPRNFMQRGLIHPHEAPATAS